MFQARVVLDFLHLVPRPWLRAMFDQRAKTGWCKDRHRRKVGCVNHAPYAQNMG